MKLRKNNAYKFFVEELQKNGYEIDYKKIVDIYKTSRNSDGFKKRQLKKRKKQLKYKNI